MMSRRLSAAVVVAVTFVSLLVACGGGSKHTAKRTLVKGGAEAGPARCPGKLTTTVYVANSKSNTVTAINDATKSVIPNTSSYTNPVPVGPDPRAIAAAPDGAYV